MLRPLFESADGIARNAAAAPRTEEQALLCAVRIDAETAARELRGLARDVLDWRFVLEQSHLHGVGPLLWERLGRPGEAGPVADPAVTANPPAAEDAAKVLRRSHYQAALLHLFARENLKPFLEGMAREGRRVAALQGLALSSLYYESPAQRPLTDVDLCVAPGDMPAAESLLERLGWQAQTGGQRLYRKGPGPALELHGPDDYPYADMAGLLARAAPCPGEDFLAPLPEDQLILHALHIGVHHARLRLIWVSDLARIVAKTAPFPWDSVGRRLARHPGRAAAALALEAAVDWCGCEVPPEILRLGRGSLRRRAFQWLFTRPPLPKIETLGVDVLATAPAAVPGRILRRLFPPAGFMRRRYGLGPRDGLALAYARRLAGLAGDCGRLIAQALKGLAGRD